MAAFPSFFTLHRVGVLSAWSTYSYMQDLQARHARYQNVLCRRTTQGLWDQRPLCAAFLLLRIFYYAFPEEDYCLVSSEKF